MASEAERGDATRRARAERQPAPARNPVRYCAVYTCLNNYKTHPHLAYFSIPIAGKRCLTWLKKIHRMDILKNGRVSGYHRVCEEHFKPSQMLSGGSRRRLSARAVPALRLPLGDSFVTVNEAAAPASPPAPPSPEPAPQPAQLPASAPSPKARARAFTTSTLEIFEYIDKTPKRDTRKLRRCPPPGAWLRRQPAGPPAAPAAELADFFTACDRHLNQNMAEFVKLIAQLRQQEGEGDDGLHSLCARLLVAAPAAYRLLRPALALPPPAALRRRLAPLLLHCNAQLEDLLKLRVERMTEREKHCTVSLQIIDVRPHLFYNITFDRIIGLHEIDGSQEPWPARHCALLSARALLGSWSQPAALCWLARADAGELRAWADGALRRLLAAGLRVRALVADPAAAAARRPDVDAARPFFHVDEHKIYFMYDPPRLMKLLLCKFIVYDFHFEKSIAKWDDVVQYRKLEKHKPLTLTPQLTDALTGGGALRRARALTPRRAARLLPRALPAALAHYHERGLLGATAPATLKLVLKINDLFEILDSTATSTGRQNHARGLSADSERTGFLSYMKSFFKALKLKDRSDVESPDSKEFCDSWQVSIATVLALREDLAPLQPRLPTRRLHLDDRVAAAARRAAGPRPTVPTCRQTFAAFKKLFFDDILRSPGKEMNVDLNSFLTMATSITGTSLVSSDRFDIDEEAEVLARDYRSGRGRRRGLAAAAARLLAAARRVHGRCAAAAGWLAGPPRAPLLRLLRQLDAALTAALRSPQPAPARLADLLLDLHVLDCDLPCACFPLQFLKKLFLRLRLYDILRENQVAFKKCDDDVKFHVNDLE